MLEISKRNVLLFNLTSINQISSSTSSSCKKALNSNLKSAICAELAVAAVARGKKIAQESSRTQWEQNRNSSDTLSMDKLSMLVKQTYFSAG